MSVSTYRVYNPLGNYLTELDVVGEREWVLNDIGSCSFDIATSDPKCTEDILQYGNLLYIEHASLPPWVGVFDVEREWHHGYVKITALSAERILSLRAMPLENVTATPGNIFRRMLEYANAAGGTQIFPGTIYDGGSNASVDLATSAFDHTRRLAEWAAQEFDVTPSLLPTGILTLKGNWYQRRAVDAYLLIHEGAGSPLELPDPIMVEQGEFWTEIIGYNNAATRASRVSTGPKRDAAAFAKYGLRQTNRIYSNVPDKETIIVNVDSALKLESNPRKTLTVYLTDVLDENGRSIYFPKLRLGNLIHVLLVSAGFYGSGIGFDGYLRITGMQYADNAGKIKLTTELYYG